MDYNLLKEQLATKSVEELMEIQQEALLTIRPCLVALNKSANVDVNKGFFLFCMACVGCDKKVDENEYQLIKKFININVTISQVQEYVNELLNNKLLDFAYELTTSIKNISNEGKEELIRFACCFLISDKFNQDKEEFLNKLINIH